MRTRFYSENPDYTQISKADKDVRDRIIAIISQYTQEMEGYSYYGSNPGVSQDDYEDIAEEIMIEFGVKG